MSVIAVEILPKPASFTQFDRVQIRRWSGLTTGDTGEPVALSNHADRSVRVSGSFNGCTVHIEGFIGDPTSSAELTNDANWLPLTDPSDNFLQLTTAAIEAVSQVVLYVRPRVSGGTAPSIVVHLLVKE